jgi:predicted dehydrogenase
VNNGESQSNPINIGIIGCGTISSIYMEMGKLFPSLHVTACADIDEERARAQAAKHDIPNVYTVAELLADPAIDIVINLTIPQAHAEVALAALEAGKSVYNEKPLAISREDARRTLDVAAARGLRVGCAPDTFLGGGLQTCRALIDQGVIGRPVGANAAIYGSGPESWHHNPDFFYQEGAGPLFDMGPYYLTALATLLGPAMAVSGSARITRSERTIGSGPRAGERIAVTTPTHVTALIEYQECVATLTTSFDTAEGYTPRLEIFGSEGSLRLPDPNSFGGPVQLRLKGGEWQEVPIEHGFTSNSRGIGVADMAFAMAEGRPHRASGELAYHVLDTMHVIYEAAEQGRRLAPQSRCERPAALPVEWPEKEN